jgi:hypothetical protein
MIHFQCYYCGCLVRIVKEVYYAWLPVFVRARRLGTMVDRLCPMQNTSTDHQQYFHNKPSKLVLVAVQGRGAAYV